MQDMDAEALRAHLAQVKATDVTKTVHSAPYAAISPTRPELSQAGKTVLITGGGTGCGLAIAKAFVAAKASRVVIVGRREAVLSSAKKTLEDDARRLASPTAIVFRRCDVTAESEVEALWADADVGYVDVLVLNAAKFQTKESSLVNMGFKEVWSMYEGNVKGPLHMAEKFQKQSVPHGKPTAPKFLVNVATAAIHQFDRSFSPLSMALPSYGLTKNAGTLALQLVAADVEPSEMQVVSFHPGVLYTEVFDQLQLDTTALPWDQFELPGSFAVWLASPEARFLHGRFVWASWDVEELATGDIRRRLDADFEFLKVGVAGLKGNKLVH